MHVNGRNAMRISGAKRHGIHRVLAFFPAVRTIQRATLYIRHVRIVHRDRFGGRLVHTVLPNIAYTNFSATATMMTATTVTDNSLKKPSRPCQLCRSFPKLLERSERWLGRRGQARRGCPSLRLRPPAIRRGPPHVLGFQPGPPIVATSACAPQAPTVPTTASATAISISTSCRRRRIPIRQRKMMRCDWSRTSSTSRSSRLPPLPPRTAPWRDSQSESHVARCRACSGAVRYNVVRHHGRVQVTGSIDDVCRKAALGGSMAQALYVDDRPPPRLSRGPQLRVRPRRRAPRPRLGAQNHIAEWPVAARRRASSIASSLLFSSTGTWPSSRRASSVGPSRPSARSPSCWRSMAAPVAWVRSRPR